MVKSYLREEWLYHMKGVLHMKILQNGIKLLTLLLMTHLAFATPNCPGFSSVVSTSYDSVEDCISKACGGYNTCVTEYNKTSFAFHQYKVDAPTYCTNSCKSPCESTCKSMKFAATATCESLGFPAAAVVAQNKGQPDCAYMGCNKASQCYYNTTGSAHDVCISCTVKCMSYCK